MRPHPELPPVVGLILPPAATSAVATAVAGTHIHGRIAAVVAGVLAAGSPAVALWLNAHRGTPGSAAPQPIQAVADELCDAIGGARLPVTTTAEVTVIAALAALGKGRRIEIGPLFVGLPADQRRAILAHEVAHSSRHHQLAAVVVGSGCWVMPAIVGMSAAANGAPSLLAALLAAAGTVAGVAGWCALLRRQELDADRIAATEFHLVSNGLPDYLSSYASTIPPRARLFARPSRTHPAPLTRVARLDAVPNYVEAAEGRCASSAPASGHWAATNEQFVPPSR